jgi:hypothetical protein
MSLTEAFNEAGILAKLSVLVGVVPLVVAIAYAIRPTDPRLALLRPISLAAIFAGVCGATAGLIVVLRGIAATLSLSKPVFTMAGPFVGLSEALVPILVNFGCLTVAWVLVAVGMLRRQRMSIEA